MSGNPYANKIYVMALAVLSVNSTCGFTAYQPDVPESLEHD